MKQLLSKSVISIWDCKFIFTIFMFFILLTYVSYSQDHEIDSIKSVLETASLDTNKVNTLITLSSYFYMSSPAEAIRYGTIAKDIAEQINFTKGVGYALKAIGMGYYFQGDYWETINYWQQT